MSQLYLITISKKWGYSYSKFLLYKDYNHAIEKIKQLAIKNNLVLSEDSKSALCSHCDGVLENPDDIERVTMTVLTIED